MSSRSKSLVGRRSSKELDIATSSTKLSSTISSSSNVPSITPTISISPVVSSNSIVDPSLIDNSSINIEIEEIKNRLEANTIAYHTLNDKIDKIENSSIETKNSLSRLELMMVNFISSMDHRTTISTGKLESVSVYQPIDVPIKNEALPVSDSLLPPNDSKVSFSTKTPYNNVSPIIPSSTDSYTLSDRKASSSSSRISMKNAHDNKMLRNDITMARNRSTSGSRKRDHSVPPVNRDVDPDPEIDDTENVGTSPYDDLAIWAQERERLYPYLDYRELYKDLPTLLSSYGRQWNYVLFASRAHFDRNLYPTVMNTHAQYLMEKQGMPPTGRNHRPVTSDKLNIIPPMDYVSIDTRIAAKYGWDNDLFEDTDLFAGIPREVILGSKVVPKTKPQTMNNEIQLYVSTRYYSALRRLPEGMAMAKATIDQIKAAWSVAPEAQNLDKVKTDQDGNIIPFTRATIIEYAKKVKSEGSSLNVVLPKLESVSGPSSGNNSYIASSTSGLVNDNIGVDSLEAANHQEQIQQRQRELGSVTDGMSYLRKLVGDDQMVHLDIVTVNMIKTIHNPKVLTPSEMIKVVADIQRNSTPAVYDGIPMEKAPSFYLELIITISKYSLGIGDIISIISNKFGPNLQAWLNNEIINTSTLTDNLKIPTILKNFRTQYMGQRLTMELQRKLNDMKLFLVPATHEELSLFYAQWNKIKVALSMCDPTNTDLRLMQAFICSFPSTLTAGISNNGLGLKTINEAWNIISITASGYYDREKTRSMYRQINLAQQIVVKAKADNAANAANVHSVRDSYRDVDLDEESYENDSLSTYLHSINRKKEKYAKKRESKELKVEPSSAEDSEYSDMEDSYAQVTVVHNLRKFIPIDKRDMKCFHCGVKGHMVGECDIAQNGSPQTTKGQLAWAEFCKLRGEAKQYSLKYQLERHEQWQKRKRYGNRNENRRYPRNLPIAMSSDNNNPISVGLSNDSVEEDDTRSVVPLQKNRNKDVTTISSAVYSASDIDVSDMSEYEELSNNKVKTIFRVSAITSDTFEDIAEAEAREKLVSSSICLPIEIIPQNNKVPIEAGHALSDQGCIHTLIRRSFKDKILPKVPEKVVNGHYVVGATSEVELPISAKFAATLSSNGQSLGDKKTVIYIVEDIKNHSIMCDLIIGRPTMAESDFHCIDTRNGILFNKDKPDKQVQCSPACIVKTSSGNVIMPKELRNTIRSSKAKNKNKRL